MGSLEKPCHLLVILIIIGACAFTTVHGQFTLTGFPVVAAGSTHTVTCSYPRASSYKWRDPAGEEHNAASYTFTVVSTKHNGLWHCDAVVGGVTKTEIVPLLVYCNGVYATSASITNPSIGDSIDINCKVISPSGEQVQWSYTTPGSVNKDVAAVTASEPNGKCDYYHHENDNIKFVPSTVCKPSKSNRFFNLHIKKVSTSHEGYWRCYDFGKGESGCYSEPVHIAIAKPPKNPPALTGFDNPILGTNHDLTCDAWQPFVRPLTYNWYKDGVQISSGNESTWRLQPVKKEANGKYKCVVVDKVKNLTAEANDTLTVYYVASWNPAVEQKKDNQVWIGQSVNLTLNIEAYPLPTSIKWFTDGNTTTLLNVTTTKISDNTWILNIISVEEHDYGNYTANVTNAAGSAFFVFQILPASPPEAPTALKALKLKDTNALAVTFTAGSNGGAPQNFTIEYNVKGEMEIEYIDGIKDLLKTKTVTQEITNLLSGTLYQIKVVAINGVGKGQYSNVIEEKTDAAAMPVWQIVVIALAALLFIVIMFLVIFFVARRKYKEVPAEAKGQDWKKRPISSFVPAGVEMIETVDDGVDNPVLVIKEEKELEKIEPVEDIPVTRSFYHDLNKRVQSRSKDNRKSMTSPFVNSGLAPVVEDEYAVVDKRRKTKNQNGQNDRQSKTASSMAYAAVDFAKKKFRKQSNTGDDKADPKQKTPQNVGVDGTLYAEVTIAKNRPPVANKPKASRKPRAREEQTAYAQVDFDRSVPGVKTDDFEMV